MFQAKLFRTFSSKTLPNCFKQNTFQMFQAKLFLTVSSKTLPNCLKQNTSQMFQAKLFLTISSKILSKCFKCFDNDKQNCHRSHFLHFSAQIEIFSSLLERQTIFLLVHDYLICSCDLNSAYFSWKLSALCI